MKTSLRQGGRAERHDIESRIPVARLATDLDRRNEQVAEALHDSRAYVSVLGELWILKDRQAVLEQVLARHGIPAPETVEQFEPDGKFKAELDAERQAWARRMVGALFRKSLPPVS